MNYEKIIAFALLGFLATAVFIVSFESKPEIVEKVIVSEFTANYLKAADAEPNTSVTIVLNLKEKTVAHAAEKLRDNNTFQPYVGECNMVRQELQTQVTSYWMPIVRSNSMYPCLDPTIISAVELATPATYWYSELQVGDVVAMDITQQEQKYYKMIGSETRQITSILHRIVAKVNDTFITKGDNNLWNDVEYFNTYLTPENYQGLVMGVNHAK